VTRIAVLVHQPLQGQLFSASDRQRLESLGEVRWAEGGKLTPEKALELLRGCAVAIGSWGTVGPTAEIVPHTPDLRLWVHAAGTVKHFFGPHLKGRDVAICSCAPAIAECVAEMTVGQLIVGLKRVLPNAAANQQGAAPKPANSFTLASSTIGVIAASQVGRHVLNFLRPFRPQVLLYDPFVTAEQAAALGARKVSDLLELCRSSNAVTLHTPNLPETQQMLGAQHFKAMRDDAIFVNTSRGSCIDQAALLDELQRGRLFAFLDVTTPEPLPNEHPLRRLPNVLVTSHIAGGADLRIGAQAVDDVAAFVAGRSPTLRVTEDMLARMA